MSVPTRCEHDPDALANSVCVDSFADRVNYAAAVVVGNLEFVDHHGDFAAASFDVGWVDSRKSNFDSDLTWAGLRCSDFFHLENLLGWTCLFKEGCTHRSS